MKRTWFKRCGWVFLPVSVPGAILMVAALAMALQVFVAIDRHSHSVSDTLYGVFPYYGCIFLLLNWVGSNTCDHKP